MIDLFSNIPTENPVLVSRSIIPDLILIKNYISDTTHDMLLAQIDKNEWSNELRRRVQHYGYKYDYRARNINVGMKVCELPLWAGELGERLVNDGYFQTRPDQVIVNEYLPGQGITDHIDCEPCFEDTIISISLSSFVTMNFTHRHTKEKVPVILPPKSAVILKGKSRFEWLHGIPARKSDKIEGIKRNRTRRVSLTYRRVILT